jgi:hypothetical protein
LQKIDLLLTLLRIQPIKKITRNIMAIPDQRYLEARAKGDGNIIRQEVYQWGGTLIERDSNLQRYKSFLVGGAALSAGYFLGMTEASRSAFVNMAVVSCGAIVAGAAVALVEKGSSWKDVAKYYAGTAVFAAGVTLGMMEAKRGVVNNLVVSGSSFVAAGSAVALLQDASKHTKNLMASLSSMLEKGRSAISQALSKGAEKLESFAQKEHKVFQGKTSASSQKQNPRRPDSIRYPGN